MAEKKVIELVVKTNATQVAQDVNKISTASKDAQTNVTNLGTASTETTAKMGGFKDIKEAVTKLVPGLGAAEGGVMKLGAQFTKLLANPIVLLIAGIVASLKLVYEAFQSNVQGGKDIAQVWAGLSAVGTQVKDAVMGLVRSFAYAFQAAYKFATFDFTGAAESMKKANQEAATSYNQLGKAIDGTTYKIVKNLENQQQVNNKAKKEQAVRQSEINKLLVQSRETLTDETASMKEKKKALEAVTKAEIESSKEKVRTIALDLKILQTKAKALGGQAEIKMKQEIREATIALNEAETENAMTGIKLNKQRKMLLRQEKEEGKAAADAAKENAKAKSDAEKEVLKNKEEAIKKIRELETAYSDSLLSEEAKEVVGVQRKYKALYDEAVKYGLDTTKLKENEKAELLKIEDKYDQQVFDKIAQLTDTEQQKLYDAYQKEVTAAKGNKDLLLALETDYNKKKEALDKAEADRKTATKLKEAEILLSEDEYKLLQLQTKYEAEQLLYKDNAEILLALKNKYEKDVQDIETASSEKTKELRERNIKFVIESMTQILSITQDLATMSENKYKEINDKILANENLTDKQKQVAIERNNARAKKSFEANKKYQIASTLIQTFATARDAYQSQFQPTKDISSPIRGAIAAAIATTGGLVAIKKIKSTQFQGTAIPSGSGGEGGGSVPTMSAPQFNVVGQSGINQLASLNQQPIQAYVVSGQVTSQQALDRNRLENATLGG